jgi:hypothetical protein
MSENKIADQFSDDEMNQIKHYGQMLGSGVTSFDEAVEEALNRRQATREAAPKRCVLPRLGPEPALVCPNSIPRPSSSVKR